MSEQGHKVTALQSLLAAVDEADLACEIKIMALLSGKPGRLVS